jgi:hypothetical protein
LALYLRVAILDDRSSDGLELEEELGLIARLISDKAAWQPIWAGKYEE